MKGALTRTRTIRPLELLDRILGESSLAKAVQALPAAALARLIAHIGLEDSGELVSLTTTHQLRDLLDLDLWRAEESGLDEAFQAQRVALWLNAMVEAGDEFVAEKLGELPEEIVMLALHQSVLVIDIDQLALEMVDRRRDVDLIEKALESCLYQELGEFRVIARAEAGWDATLGALLALDQRNHSLLQRILERCCSASTELVEESGGLYEVLSSAEMLESDAAAERQDRRARQGFVAPSDAKSFLALARQTRLKAIVEARSRDPITAAYFRERERMAPSEWPSSNAGFASEGATSQDAGPAGVSTRTAPHSIVGQLLVLLRDAGVHHETSSQRQLMTGGRAKKGGRLREALEELLDEELEAYGARVEELAYLANLVVVGGSRQGQRFDLDEATEATLVLCELGLEYLLAREALEGDAKTRRLDATRILRAEGADKLFRIGWHLLHRDGRTTSARDWHDVPLEAKRALDQALSAARARFS